MAVAQNAHHLSLGSASTTAVSELTTAKKAVRTVDFDHLRLYLAGFVYRQRPAKRGA